MANTIPQEIAQLESRLTSITAKIEKVEEFRSMEEGSASARFKTDFTDAEKLYKERDRIKTRLTMLGWGGVQ